MKEALLYHKSDKKSVKCHLCAHRCTITPGNTGICKVRKNIDGTLFSLVYGRSIANHIDPIEKKPLYHFYPGSKTLSIGTSGCNFQCSFCQNCEISQVGDEQFVNQGSLATPEEIVKEALQAGCKSIAYTYNEPTIFYEYAYDIAEIARQQGIKNIFVSNGFMTEEMLDQIIPRLDAINIDLKAFKNETYQHLTGGRLHPVLESLQKIAASGIWLEVTTLIIPGINDSPQELQNMAKFIAQELGTNIPWHISRFFPAYKLKDIPPTPMETLFMAHETGLKAGLNYIYLGNIPNGEYQNTRCPKCKALLIERIGYRIISSHLENRLCPNCKTPIAITL
ncbi:AmmeMemoRadiSam system radical SAM enzyme [Thermophagus sp. OGC60D27]|uniref:AmmeMemoRadiSam system radical SAM enzyme n=1 Tax=Thermophagus sp. OGC60D27 TaxID=3458415 RepID=UPI0040382CEE